MRRAEDRGKGGLFELRANGAAPSAQSMADALVLVPLSAPLVFLCSRCTRYVDPCFLCCTCSVGFYGFCLTTCAPVSLLRPCTLARN